jgi:prepilin-type N-terminal cleavage/methylation domain-containing protein
MALAFRVRRGYTLPELLTVVVLVGILASLTAPPLGRWVLSMRARATLDRVAVALYRTRMYAVRDGRSTELLLQLDEGNCVRGFAVRATDDPPPVGLASLDDALGPLCLRHSRSPRDRSVRFNSRGIVQGSNATFYFTDPGIRHRLVISIAGRVRREF